jgi:hypothetical protein
MLALGTHIWQLMAITLSSLYEPIIDQLVYEQMNPTQAATQKKMQTLSFPFASKSSWMEKW